MKEGQSLFFNDGAGNRLQATRSGVTTRYIYDTAGNLLAEADSLNNITRYYIYGLGLMAMVTPGNQVYCYHFNAVGSTIAMTDQTQAVVNKYAYDPFGNIVNQVEAVFQPFKFVGQFGVMTEPNGFYYMKARYYDPDVGRFISEDPIGFDGGDVNLYAYVANNPVNEIDPSGLLGLISPGFKNVKWPPQNPYLPGPNTQFADPNWMSVISPTRGNAIPGQWGSAAAAVGVPLSIVGTGAIFGGVAAAPAIGRTVYINAPQIAEIIIGALPTGTPPTRTSNIGLLLRLAWDLGVSAGQSYFPSKP